MSSALGLERESQCRNCTAGYYCQNSSTVVATVPCEPGFYCEEGTATPTLDCWKGHHCAGGNPIPFPCEAGTYQNATGQASCRTCPAGYYCNEAEVFPDECPSGYYCPPETSFATKFPCPNGTFNNKTTTTSIDECSPCIGGMYCETAGLSWPTGHCSDGYYCGRGSHSATPDDGEDESIYLGETCSDQGDAQVNGVCPRGHFCPEGSSSPTQCPPGKMNAAKGQYNLNQCEECRAGFYCPRSATINATDLCEPGFYCPGGDVDPTFECTLGHFCAGGDKEPVNCPSGSYQNVTGQAECHPCPAGYFCEEAQVTPAECPKGHYCPAGTKYATEFPCPNGTFSNKTMLSTVAECTECIATMYCETEGLFEPTGLCHGGYYCAHGSATPTPGDNENYFYIGDTCSDQSDEEVNGVCPIGHYCPIGSSAPLQCPPGTMSDARGLSDIGECQECLGGFVCPESATINATVPCEPGFWCVHSCLLIVLSRIMQVSWRRRNAHFAVYTRTFLSGRRRDSDLVPSWKL